MPTTAEVQGLTRLVSTLRKAGADLTDLKDANAAAGRTVADWASVTAPRRSGALGSSVRAARRVSGARVLGGGAAVPYAGPIHWGWPARNIEAQPFISKAAQSTEPAWVQTYLDDVQQALDSVKGA
jgi:hypothetical protein